MLRALKIRSYLAAPLISRGRLIGGYSFISSRDGRNYRERDIRLAEEFARIASFAVEHANLYESARRAIATRDEILGIVAHDLRTPLNIVMMQSQLLRRHDGRSEGGNLRQVDAILRAGERMNRLIQDMLDVARLEAGSLAIEHAVVHSAVLVQEAVQSHRDAAIKARVELRVSASAQIPEILGDRDRLLQVLDNLIGNALKFTPAGGTVTVGAEATEEYVAFCVTDTGAGIRADDLPKLFDRFWQAKRTDRRGAGLGLPIVKGIVDAHGGQVWIESVFGEGSAFHFTVPRAQPVLAKISVPASLPY